MAEEYIGINRLKEREDANKYPRRKCVRCIRYPCFSGQGIGTHAINLANIHSHVWNIDPVQAIPYIPSLSILWNRDGIDSHWFRLVLRLGLLSWNIKS